MRGVLACPHRRPARPAALPRVRPRYASVIGLATISALLGHASTAVTSQVYTHMLKGADRAAVDVHAARILPGEVGGHPDL